MTHSDMMVVIQHVVHDYALRVSAGTEIKTYHKPPINTHIQYSFLVGCRKFADFFLNNRGGHGDGIIAKDFLGTKFGFKFSVWKKWLKHMNTHLFHLSRARVESTTQWTGQEINQQLLDEFMSAWKKFRPLVHEPFRSEFERQILLQSSKPEYQGLDLT